MNNVNRETVNTKRQDLFSKFEDFAIIMERTREITERFHISPGLYQIMNKFTIYSSIVINIYFLWEFHITLDQKDKTIAETYSDDGYEVSGIHGGHENELIYIQSLMSIHLILKSFILLIYFFIIVPMYTHEMKVEQLPIYN